MKDSDLASLIEARKNKILEEMRSLGLQVTTDTYAAVVTHLLIKAEERTRYWRDRASKAYAKGRTLNTTSVAKSSREDLT